MLASEVVFAIAFKSYIERLGHEVPMQRPKLCSLIGMSFWMSRVSNTWVQTSFNSLMPKSNSSVPAVTKRPTFRSYWLYKSACNKFFRNTKRLNLVNQIALAYVYCITALLLQNTVLYTAFNLKDHYKVVYQKSYPERFSKYRSWPEAY